jgi:hypothetical protein
VNSPEDPQGKRALFSIEGPVPREPRDATGKAALFSTATRRPGTVVLECSRCHGRTRVGYAEFARRHLPVWLWLPWRAHSRYLECPACDHRAWVTTRWLR